MPVINKGSDYFQTVTYTGNGGTNTITGLSFKPDFVWIKGRSGATDHALYDAVRGTTLDLASNTTAAETTQSTGLTSFNSDGFTLGALSKVNTNSATYVAWCWKANGSGSSIAVNAYGSTPSIASTVSANQTAGFSVVTYTGTGANATVGHGLGVAPSFIIAKRRTGTTANWPVWHSSFAGTEFILLNSTNAKYTTPTTVFTSSPTSTVINIGTDSDVNQSTQSHVLYCFAAVAGYSAFGSYTGNGSADGPFVFTNFQPRFIMVKRTDTVESWNIVDTSRDIYNQSGLNLYPNLSNAEGSNNLCDVLSNGFKIRNTWAGANASGGTYIYACFASNPFKFALAR